MLFHDAGVLRSLRQLADRYDLLLIFDEIFTGFGRTGSMFALDAAGVVPDIVTLGKGLSGGTLPIAATIATAKIYEAFLGDDPGMALMHGPTFMGNALATAAANASLDLFEREPRVTQAQLIGTAMEEQLACCREIADVKDVRVLGAIGVVELNEIGDIDGLKQHFIDAGVWIRPFRNIVYLTPALTVSSEELETLTSAVSRVLAARCNTRR
jgi:adenosylmethionine-8-amino-7-oxononanoate aminotransferase